MNEIRELQLQKKFDSIKHHLSVIDSILDIIEFNTQREKICTEIYNKAIKSLLEFNVHITKLQFNMLGDKK